ncbi:MAG: aminotransferase class III-fold pyridoxal phosphate-dependent enzyme [Cyclobacteriaceae bacterium]
MNLFDVYPRYEIEPVKGQGCFVWDRDEKKYLDLYCGHAVISIGHSHPHYVSKVGSQLKNLGFYSNSVRISLQEDLAKKLGELSGYPDYDLFLCNSGAEATENAMKLASFHTRRKKIIVFEKGFHGRTSLAMEATDNRKQLAPVNESGNVIRLPLNDLSAVATVMDDSVAGIIVEGIQGIAGIYEPTSNFLQGLEKLCKDNGSLLILDEVQSGYGRSGKFFAHQYHDVKPDIITTGKGMANGFPMASVLISPEIEAWHGMLGTTFGGNHLACAAGLATLEILEKEDLILNAQKMGNYLISALKEIPGVVEVRGRGLMIGVELEYPSKEVRARLLFDHNIFTGSADNPNTLRILPPLCVSTKELDQLIEALKKITKA